MSATSAPATSHPFLCHNAGHILEVEVPESRAMPGHYLVGGLRDAIKDKKPNDCQRVDADHIQIYNRHGANNGEPIEGCLDPGKEYNYVIPPPPITTTPLSVDPLREKSVDDLVFYLKAPGRTSGSLENLLDDLINGKVIEREDTLLEIIRFLCRLLDASASGIAPNDKAKFPIACTVCGSGGGKTTLCCFVEHTAWKKVIKQRINDHISNPDTMLKGMQPITTLSTVFATFNSTCNYDDDEAGRLDRGASLGIRLLASRNGWSHSDVSTFLRDSKTVAPYAKVSLRSCLQQIVPADNNEALIILIDEILRLRDDDTIHSILIQLSCFQQECLRNGKKVFVMVTSLSSDPPASLTRDTQRRVTPISLKPISPAEVLKQAKTFVANLKATRQDAADYEHHLISEFCSTGGLVKQMKATSVYFADESKHLMNCATDLVRNEPYLWASTILLSSLYGVPLTSTSPTSSTHITLQELINNHRVTVVETLVSNDWLELVVRIPTYILRSIGSFTSDLTPNQQLHLKCVMNTLSVDRQTDGSYAKPFEVALMRVLCLRLSLSPTSTTTLAKLLPNCTHNIPEVVKCMEFSKTDCVWVEVEELTKAEVTKERLHGTMVCSRKINEGAVEGFFYLITATGLIFILFFQMKFWRYCAPNEIKDWEKKIYQRAKEKFGLADGAFAAAFFSTSKRFRTTSSISAAKEATEHLLEPFGVCPMMLYARERAAAEQVKRKRKRTEMKEKENEKKGAVDDDDDDDDGDIVDDDDDDE